MNRSWAVICDSSSRTPSMWVGLSLAYWFLSFFQLGNQKKQNWDSQERRNLQSCFETIGHMCGLRSLLWSSGRRLFRRPSLQPLPLVSHAADFRRTESGTRVGCLGRDFMEALTAALWPPWTAIVDHRRQLGLDVCGQPSMKATSGATRQPWKWRRWRAQWPIHDLLMTY